MIVAKSLRAVIEAQSLLLLVNKVVLGRGQPLMGLGVGIFMMESEMGDYCTPLRGILEITPTEGQIICPEDCILPQRDASVKLSSVARTNRSHRHLNSFKW